MTICFSFFLILSKEIKSNSVNNIIFAKIHKAKINSGLPPVYHHNIIQLSTCAYFIQKRCYLFIEGYFGYICCICVLTVG